MNNENLKPFKKGSDERRNLSGRPRKLPELDVLLADVLGEEKDGETTVKAILDKLAALAKKGNVRAIEIMLDRAYGKAIQSVNISDRTITVLVEPENENENKTDERGEKNKRYKKQKR